MFLAKKKVCSCWPSIFPVECRVVETWNPHSKHQSFHSSMAFLPNSSELGFIKKKKTLRIQIDKPIQGSNSACFETVRCCILLAVVFSIQGRKLTEVI